MFQISTALCKPQNKALIVVGLALCTLASAGLVNVTHAPSATANSQDASLAVRYDADGTVIGDIIPSLIDEDDHFWLDATTPFPTNFFGTKYANICITTNGSIYPTNAGCTDDYDYGVGELAIRGEAPMIAALATDMDPGESTLMIENENGILPTGPVTNTTGSSAGAGTLTITSSASVSNLAIGDSVYFWGTGNSTLDNRSFTITGLDAAAKSISFAVGSAVPDGVAQGNWYYYRSYTFGSFTNTSASGTTITALGITEDESGNGLKVGDHVAFQSADSALNSKIFEVTAVTPTSISFELPIGATPPSPTAAGKWFFSDGVGAVRTVNYGTTTIDGQTALVVTWYRVPQNDADNAPFLSNTVQLIIIKRTTGNATIGFDFDIEFNYGTLLDDEDGYDVTDPTDSCSAYSRGAIVGLPNCRWGVGTASYVSGIQVQSIAFNGTTATITTNAPHGIAGLGSEVWIELDASADAVLNNLNSNDRGRATVSGPSTLSFPVATPTTDTTFTGALPTINLSDVYELYGGYSIDRLADTGDTAMVNNSLNTAVLGRYRFTMSGGTPSGFATLEELVAGIVPTESTTNPPAPTKVTINLSGNGGSCTSSSLTGDAGTWATLPKASDCSKNGGILTGWQDRAATATYAPGASINLSSDNTLYAVWKSNNMDSAATNASGPANATPQRTAVVKWRVGKAAPIYISGERTDLSSRVAVFTVNATSRNQMMGKAVAQAKTLANRYGGIYGGFVQSESWAKPRLVAAYLK